MKNQKNVFIFWIGDREKISALLSTIEMQGFNPILGPSSDEHNYLYSNFVFYKKSYDLKIWSFCSDIWRLFILSKSNGLYIDTSVDVGKDFAEFYDIVSKQDYYFVKQRRSVIASGVMGSFGDGRIFCELLEIYKSFDQYHPRVYFTIMYVITSWLTQKYGLDNSWDIWINPNYSIFVDVLPSIRNAKHIIKRGSGSWIIDKNARYLNNNKQDLYATLEDDWRERKFPTGAKKRYRYAIDDLFSPDILNLRKLYEDEIMDDNTLKLIRKNINYIVDFDSLLIWSIIWRAFHRTRKKERNLSIQSDKIK